MMRTPFFAIAIAFASTSLIGLIAEASAAEPADLAVRRALPVGHAAISVTILGYFGILATHRVRAVGPKLAGFAAAFGFISLLSIAQLYVVQLYVSGLAGGFLIGVAALLILTAATWRHIGQIEQRFTGLVGWIGLIALLVAGAINIAGSLRFQT